MTTLIKSFSDTWGRIDLYWQEGPIDTYLILASGIMQLSLLKKYLKHVKELDNSSLNKFNHVVDTSKVRLANPLNPLYLRTINQLKNLNLYIVIVPSDFLRVMVNLTRWINKPDYVFKSLKEAGQILRLNLTKQTKDI